MILNVNSLNSPTKRHILTKWHKKQNPAVCCLQETHLAKTHTESEMMKNYIPSKQTLKGSKNSDIHM
jgi:exonuclease III